MKFLPPHELEEIDNDLQRHFHFIDFKSKFNNDEILNTFWEFFQRNGRFPGSQRLIIIPKPKIPNFTKTDEVISPNQVFEKFKGTDARGLLSLQTLAALSIFFVGDTDIATDAMTEVLHSMSHQALNRENDNILIEFDRIADLITELIDLCLVENNACRDFNNKALEKVKQEVNGYQIAFDLSLAEKIQDEVDEIMVSDEKPEIPPDSIPPPLLTTDEILNETTKKMNHLSKHI